MNSPLWLSFGQERLLWFRRAGPSSDSLRAEHQALSHPRTFACAVSSTWGILSTLANFYSFLGVFFSAPPPRRLSPTLTRLGPLGRPLHKPCHQEVKQWPAQIWSGFKSYSCSLCVSGQVPSFLRISISWPVNGGYCTSAHPLGGLCGLEWHELPKEHSTRCLAFHKHLIMVDIYDVCYTYIIYMVDIYVLCTYQSSQI